MNIIDLWPALGFMLALLTAMGSVIGWLWSESRKNSADNLVHHNKIQNDIQRCFGEVDQIRNELYRDYMPIAGLTRFEKLLDDLKTQLTHLDNKFDSKIDKMRDDRRDARPTV